MKRFGWVAGFLVLARLSVHAVDKGITMLDPRLDPASPTPDAPARANWS
jgi:hypothetical protein